MEFIRKQEVVLYTVITGDYDILKEIPKKFYFPDRFDYICLTDSNNIKIIHIKL